MRNSGTARAGAHRIIHIAIALSLLFGLAACIPSMTGPKRLYSVEEEAAAIQKQLTLFQKDYQDTGLVTTEATRNEIITARMRAIDLYYYDYEEALTREQQNTSFFTSLATLGLTGTSALMAPAATKTVLDGVSVGLQGASKAYSADVLFEKTVQALQTQMRANRATVAANMIRRMKSSLADYPLSMALSDLEEYFAAGTITGALIAVSKTVGDEERAAEEDKKDAILSFNYAPDSASAILRNFIFRGNLTGPPDEAAVAKLLPILGKLVNRSNLTFQHLVAILDNPRASRLRARLVERARSAGIIR